MGSIKDWTLEEIREEIHFIDNQFEYLAAENVNLKNKQEDTSANDNMLAALAGLLRVCLREEKERVLEEERIQRNRRSLKTLARKVRQDLRLPAVAETARKRM